MSVDVEDEYEKAILLSTNNYPLCNSKNHCGDGDESEIDLGDITVAHTILVSYENIHQNIVSYPHVTDVSDDDYYVRRYTIPGGGEIIMTTDMRVEDMIVSTLSGDVPDGIKLVKIERFTDDEYSVEYK